MQKHIFLFVVIYQKTSNKDKFYNRILFFISPLTIIYIYIRINYNFIILPDYGYDEDYCLFPGPDAIIACMINLIFLAFFYKIDKLFKIKTPYIITHTGKNVNKYYIIHFIIISQTSIFLRATKGEKYPNTVKYPTLCGILTL